MEYWVWYVFIFLFICSILVSIIDGKFYYDVFFFVLNILIISMVIANKLAYENTSVFKGKFKMSENPKQLESNLLALWFIVMILYIIIYFSSERAPLNRDNYFNIYAMFSLNV